MIDSVIKLINMFKDPVYHRYIEYFHRHISDSSSPSINEEGRFFVEDNGVNVKVTLPRYKVVSYQVRKNQQRISELYNTYVATKNRTTGKEIQALSKENDILLTYKSLINSSSVTPRKEYDMLAMKLAEIAKTIQQQKQKLAENPESFTSNTIALKEYTTSLIEHTRVTEKMRMLGTNEIDYYIEVMPTMSNAGKADKKKVTVSKKVPKEKKEKDIDVVKSEKKEEPPKKKREQKIKEKIIEKMLSTFPLNRFNFRIHEDCTSKQTSSPYYISRDDLIRTIENDPDLKEFFPKNFKKLKKEELCNIVFHPLKN